MLEFCGVESRKGHDMLFRADRILHTAQHAGRQRAVEVDAPEFAGLAGVVAPPQHVDQGSGQAACRLFAWYTLEML